MRSYEKKYAEFIDTFGIPIKEGLYQDTDNRDDLLELVDPKLGVITSFNDLMSQLENLRKKKNTILTYTLLELKKITDMLPRKN